MRESGVNLWTRLLSAKLPGLLGVFYSSRKQLFIFLCTGLQFFAEAFH